MSRRESSATVSLMRIALGIDFAIVFFGVLVIRGLGVFPEPAVWIGGGLAVVALIVILGLVATPVGPWLGHVFHVALLATFAIDIAIGLSVLVPIGFWLFAVIRGPQLDRPDTAPAGEGS